MAIYEILEEIIVERGLSIADVAKICNIPDSTVRGIIKRKQSTIALEVAFKLSDGLGVSLEKLNGMPEKELPEETKNSPSAAEAEPEEEQAEPAPLRSTLLHNFDQLNQEGRERLVETSDDMVSSGKYIKSGAFKMDSKKFA